MSTNRRLLIALLLFGMILFVFLSPAFNLQPSALRAAQRALALALSIMGAAVFLAGRLALPQLLVGLRSQQELLSSDDLIALTCARLC